jgi:hypothetical protein
LITACAGCAFEEDEHTAGHQEALIGDVPALVAVEGIQYVAGSGFEVELSVRRGLYFAVTHGNAGFGVSSTLAIEDGIIVVGGCPLGDLKANGLELHSGPMIGLTQSVLWDGTDGEGNALGGTRTLSYTVAITKPGHGELSGAWSQSGSVQIDLEPVEQPLP